MDTIFVKLKKYSFGISIALICLLYFFLRIFSSKTIEFGYDQPRLSSVVIDFINSGSYLTSQNYSLESPWGNFSWGPVLVYLLSPIFLISKNPIHISYVMIFINLFTILLTIKISKEFFSEKAAIVSGLVMAVHPWWIIFSRMVYQPSVVPLLVLMSLYCLFKSLEKPKSFWPIFLFISFGFLIQSYLITFAYIIICLLILVLYKKFDAFSLKNIFFAGFANLIIFVPSIFYYLNSPEMFLRFFEAKNKFYTGFLDVLNHFIRFFSGLGFEWQLGYGYQDFKQTIAFYDFYSLFLTLFFIFNITIFVYFVIKKKNIYLTTLLLLIISPILAILYIGVEQVVPRYFLYSLPFYAIIVGYNFSFLNKKAIIFLLTKFFIWLIVIFNYFNFIVNYDYKYGFLSYYSDVPYYFLDQSFKWVKEDAIKKGYESFTVSSDLQFPDENRLNWAQNYYWNYVLEEPMQKGKTGHYLMYFSPVSEISKKYVQFGPYIVSEFKK